MKIERTRFAGSGPRPSICKRIPAAHVALERIQIGVEKVAEEFDRPIVPHRLMVDSQTVHSTAARSHKAFSSELLFLASIYIGTLIFASMFIAACGPGCCFVFYSIIASISGLLMLRRPYSSRCICLAVLLLSILGMWHEKESRDTREQQSLRRQIQTLQQEVKQSKPK